MRFDSKHSPATAPWIDAARILANLKTFSQTGPFRARVMMGLWSHSFAIISAHSTRIRIGNRAP